MERAILSNPAAPSSPLADPGSRMRVGTLQYTKAGLATVFFWLLWGDFVFQMMEYVAPAIVPLRLKDLYISDRLLPIIVGTIPQIINTALNPIISSASDRYRSRLGRRIPFMLFGIPFVCAALVAMAYSTEIGIWLHIHVGYVHGWKTSALLVLVVSVLWIVFTVLIGTLVGSLVTGLVVRHHEPAPAA